MNHAPQTKRAVSIHTARAANIAAVLAVLFCTVSTAAAKSALWVPNNSDLAEFQGKLLSGTTSAHRVNSSADIDEASGIAFDNAGNLWCTNYSNSSVIEFTKAELHSLKKSPAPSAAVTISDDASHDMLGPEGLAFDKSGNLWVGGEQAGQVVEFTPSQLTAPGSPTPHIILNANSFFFDTPSNTVFDKSGNLWIVDEGISNGNGGFGEIFKYTASHVAGLSSGSNRVDPDLGIGSSVFGHLEGLAFDKEGNIWIADEDHGKVYKFLASQIGSGISQNLAPAVVLTPKTISGQCTLSLDKPYGIAVDSKGNLYVANAGTTGPSCVGSLAEFSAKAIATSGSPAPKVFISSNASGTNISFPGYLVFGPSVP